MAKAVPAEACDGAVAEDDAGRSSSNSWVVARRSALSGARAPSTPRSARQGVKKDSPRALERIVEKLTRAEERSGRPTTGIT